MMSNYRFDISGNINVETVDDAVDILRLILEDNNITVTRITIDGSGIYVGESLVCKKK